MDRLTPSSTPTPLTPMHRVLSFDPHTCTPLTAPPSPVLAPPAAGSSEELTIDCPASNSDASTAARVGATKGDDDDDVHFYFDETSAFHPCSAPSGPGDPWYVYTPSSAVQEYWSWNCLKGASIESACALQRFSESLPQSDANSLAAAQEGFRAAAWDSSDSLLFATQVLNAGANALMGQVGGGKKKVLALSKKWAAYALGSNGNNVGTLMDMAKIKIGEAQKALVLIPLAMHNGLQESLDARSHLE